MKAGNISIDLELDGRQFSVQVKNASGLLRELRRDLQTTADATKGVENHFNSFGTGLRHFMLMAASVRFALIDFRDVFLSLPTAVVKTTGEFQRLEKLLQGVSTAATDAGRALDATRSMATVMNLAKNSPFDIKALSDSFVKLKSAGIDPTNGALKTLSDGVAKFGGNSDTLHRASIALQQMAGKGVISMEELRQQLGEAVPNAMRLMAQGMGMSMAELTNKVSKGTVEAKSAIAKMLAAMQIDSQGAAEKMMDTIPGALARLTTSFELFKKEIGRQGLGTTIQGQLQEVTKFLDSPAGVEFARSIGQSLQSIATFLITLKQGLVENWEIIKSIGEALIFAFAGSRLKSAFGSFEEGLARSKTRLEETKNMLSDIRRQQADTAGKVATNLQQSAKAKYYDADELLKKANQMTQQAGKFYQQSHEYINAANKLEQGSAPGWSKDKIARLRQQAEEYKLMTVEMQNNAVATRIRSEEIRKAADKEMGLAGIQRKTAEEIANGTRAIAGSNSALQVYGSALSNAAFVKQKFADVAKIAGAAVVGFGKTLLSMTGWGLVAVAAIEAVTWAYDKLFGAAKRANDEKERGIRIDRGQGTESDLKAVKSSLATNEENIALAEADLAHWMSKKGSKNESQSYVDRMIAQRTSELARLRNVNARLKDQITEADKAVVKYENEKAVGALQTKLDNIVSEGMAKEGYYGRMQELEKQKEGASKKDIERIQKAQQELVAESKRRQIELTKDAFATLAADPSKHGVTADQFKAFEANNYKKQFEALAADVKLVNDPNQFITDPNKAEKGPVNKLTDKALKLANDLKIAKAKWEGVVGEIDEFSALRKEAEEEISAMLTEGELDTTLKGKSISKPKMTDDAVQKMVDDLTQKKVIEQGLREMPGLNAKAAQLRTEIAAIQESIDSGNYGSYKEKKEENALLKMIDKIIAKSPEAAAELEPLRKKIQEVMALSARADAARAVDDYAKGAKEQAEKIVLDTQLMYANEEDGRKLRHQKELADLQEQYQKKRLMAEGHIDLQEKLDKSYFALHSALVKRQEAESRTQLQKLKDQWEDTTTQMDNATKSWAEGFMDKMVELVTTGKADFKEFVRSMLVDLSRISLQKGIGGAVTKGFEDVGTFIKNIFNGMGSTVSTSGTKEVSTAVKGIADSFNQTGITSENLTQAMQTMSTNGVEATTAALVQQLGMAGSRQMAEAMAINSLNQLAMAAYSAASALGSSGGGSGGLFGLGGLFGAGSTAAPLAETGMMMAGEGIELIDAIGAFAFANGGIMTEFGPVPLRKYAMGGVANSPQAAIFAEAGMAEAFVPLPDGRSIPVTMRGNMGGGGVSQNIAINITINKDGSETNSTGGSSSEEAGAWRKMADRVKGVVREELMTQQRPGGILYK